MRKHIILFSALLGFILSACNQNNSNDIDNINNENSNSAITNDINGKNNDEISLTDNELVNRVSSITISQDGFFVINGVKTTKQVNFNTITISSDGFYIVDGFKTSIRADFNNLTISSDGYYVVDGIKTNIKIQFTSVEIADDGYYVINGIKSEIKAGEIYTVSFNSGCSTSIDNQNIFEGHKVERPQISRPGYELDGWFCNNEEWRFNSDIVLDDMVLVAHWTAKQFIVSFENEMGDNPENINVTFDSEFTLPALSNENGYTFDGWYNGSTKVTNGTWQIDSNVTLTAKWIAKTYSVWFNPGDGQVSAKYQIVTYGQMYNVPIPTNSYGLFVGWVCDGVLVTDNQGNSLAPWTYTENKSFTVEWELKIYNYEDLRNVGNHPQAFFKLMNDIDLDGVDWLPIRSFEGTFDGNGHSISNLSFNSSTSPYFQFGFGLFSGLDGALIKNLHIKNFYFKSENEDLSFDVGALFGHATEDNCTTISNCKVSGLFDIAEQSARQEICAGGFGGQGGEVVFENCINEISFSNATYGGGFVGKSGSEISIFSSINKGTISSKSIAGGFVGYAKVLVGSSCINEGNVTAINCAGGFAGQVYGRYNTFLDHIVNSGEIITTSTDDNVYYGTGGIVGSTISSFGNSTLSIEKSYNTGSIKGFKAGGLVGMMPDGDIYDSYNSGNIIGHYIASGIAAQVINNSSICECLASGSLSTTLSVSIKNTLAFASTGLDYIGSYYTYENVYQSSSLFIGKHGGYTNNVYGKELYVNSMHWVEYNPLTNEGDWIFHDDSFPTLYFFNVKSLELNW